MEQASVQFKRDKKLEGAGPRITRIEHELFVIICSIRVIRGAALQSTLELRPTFSYNPITVMMFPEFTSWFASYKIAFCLWY